MGSIGVGDDVHRMREVTRGAGRGEEGEGCGAALRGGWVGEWLLRLSKLKWRGSARLQHEKKKEEDQRTGAEEGGGREAVAVAGEGFAVSVWLCATSL